MSSTSKFEKLILYSFVAFVFVGLVNSSDFKIKQIISTLRGDTSIATVMRAITTEDTYQSTNPSAPIKPTLITTPASVTFRVAGDFMFARGVHRKFNNNPILTLDKIGTDFFKKADVSIVNLEGAIGSSPLQEIARIGSFKFIFPNSVINVLKKYNITTVSLANNHSLNNGWIGFSKTEQQLDESNIAHFGGPTAKYTPRVAIAQGTNLNLVIIGVHTLYDVPDIANLIKKYKEDTSNRILIMPHWGVEYQFKHSKRQERLAHSWIDAGADIVVGSHPHVVQDVEVYKDVPIVYSLGNFLFDQTESNTGEKGVQDGMTLHGKFIKDKLALYAVPIRIEGFRPQLLENKTRERRILDNFYKPWGMHEQEINGIRMFVFKTQL